MKVAAAYIRVSTDDQVEYSPKSQIKAIKKYAEKNSFFLPEHFIFSDEGISGRSIGKRNAFKKMIALAKTKPKPFDTILVWKYSRFARNREDSVVYKSMLRKQCGINVISISEPIGDDKMSVLFEAIIEAMDEYYSINLAEEGKRGMAEKARHGGLVSGPPFGYTVQNGDFVIVESEAEVIRNVFEEYVSGAGFLTLAKKLNALGVKTHKGNPIESRTIEYWLNNPVYIGKTRWNPVGKTSRNYYSKDLIISNVTHQPIIDEQLWNTVQNKLKDNKKRHKKKMREPNSGMSHWLNGLLRCGKCGRTLVNCSGYYYCSGKGKALCAGNGSISVKTIEKLIIDNINDMIDIPNIQLSFQKPSHIKTEDESKRLFKVRLADLMKRMQRVQEAYENGIDSLVEYKKNKNKLSSEIDLLNHEMNNSAERIGKEKNITQKTGKISDILSDAGVDNMTKNKVARSNIKLVIKTGSDGVELQIVFYGNFI